MIGLGNRWRVEQALPMGYAAIRTSLKKDDDEMMGIGMMGIEMMGIGMHGSWEHGKLG